MKLLHFLLLLLVLAFGSMLPIRAGTNFDVDDNPPPYDNSKPPTLSLPAAYQLAVTALGSDTNQFHCVGASITTDSGEPRWLFKFFDTNTPPKWKRMTVNFSGKTKLDYNGMTF
jgi:hypothetical protein